MQVEHIQMIQIYPRTRLIVSYIENSKNN